MGLKPSHQNKTSCMLMTTITPHLGHSVVVVCHGMSSHLHALMPDLSVFGEQCSQLIYFLSTSRVEVNISVCVCVLFDDMVLTSSLRWKSRVYKNSDGDLLLSGGRFKGILNPLVFKHRFLWGGGIWKNRMPQLIVRRLTDKSALCFIQIHGLLGSKCFV